MTVSVVISARDEFPNIVHTIHSIINDLETFLDQDEWEIIIVDNGSLNPDSWRFMAERGLYYHRNIRVHFDPIMGNVTARNKGARLAKGDYLFFSDAHMSYRIGTFQRMIQTIDESGGIVHGTVQWMGGYYPAQPSVQYSLKIGEKLWGTWNNSLVATDDWFYIPCSGHCFLGVKRQQFLDFGGYNDWFRCYGGGELYLALKWWMLGSSVAVDPRVVSYHLSAGRGYSYHQDDLIHNMMLLGYALGADALGERVYIRYLTKRGTDQERIDTLHHDAKTEAQTDATFFAARPHTPLYDVLKDRPWDTLNDNRHGKHHSYLVVFQDTWLDALDETAKQYYEASEKQKSLNEFIETHLANCIYGRS